MPNIINADNGIGSGTPGLKYTADSSGNIQFQSTGVTGLSINTGGKVVLANTGLSTASAGTFEYNGTTPFFTPSGTQRGVVPGMQYYELNSTLALVATTSAQSWLGVGCTVSAGTVYAFEALYAAIKTVGTTSHTLGTGFGGTATLNNISYFVNRYYDTTGFATANTGSIIAWIQTAANTTTMTSNSQSTYYSVIQMIGIVSINAGGTFIPQATTSASGPIYTTQIGSYFRIYPIGAAGANINVGTWA